jgi:hypothetical protein
MRKISVNLTTNVEKSLEKIMLMNNNCSISDFVNTAILALSMDKHPCLVRSDDYMNELRKKVQQSKFQTIENWCEYRQIDKARLKYLLKRCAAGHNYIGNGPTKNRHRLKEDDRVFKTHT